MVRFTARNGSLTQAMDEEVVDVGWGTKGSWQADRDLVHQPSCLRVVSAIAKEMEVSFADLRRITGMEDKDLAQAAKKLQAANLIESTSVVGGTGMIVEFAITTRGREVVAGYKDWMSSILDQL